MPPAQPGKPREVLVAGDELAAVLDRQRGKVGVGDRLAAGTDLTAEPLEDPQWRRPGATTTA